MLAIFLVAGYVFGAIPFSRIVRRLFARGVGSSFVEVPVSGTDEVYRVTSTGAAAASMTMGARAGCLIGFLDMLKVALPTFVARIQCEEPVYSLSAAVAGMIGHNWPVFNGFKGGRGVSSVYGALLVIDWLGAFAVAGGGLVIGLVILRDFVVAYLAGLWLLIPWMWFRYHDWEYLAFGIVVNVIFIAAMMPDLRQYLRFKRMGKAGMDTVMGMTPMGRGMMRMMEMLRLRKKSS